MQQNAYLTLSTLAWRLWPVLPLGRKRRLVGLERGGPLDLKTNALAILTRVNGQ